MPKHFKSIGYWLQHFKLDKMWLPYHRRPNPSSLYKRRARKDDEEEIPGFLLKHPKTEILHPENKKFGNIEIGHASMQGFRVGMEDDYVIDELSLNDHLIVAIMDGMHRSSVLHRYCPILIIYC